MDAEGEPRRNVIYYDIIGMLIFVLSAIFHDPIHDFGLTIERMAKIVLYIDEMIRQLSGSEANPQGGGSNFDEMMVGGILSSYRSKGSHREKKTPRQRSKKSQRSQKSLRSQKSQRSRDNHGVKKKHVLSPIMEKTPSPSPSRRTIKIPSYYTDTVVLSLPITTPMHPYIHRYFVISTSIGNVSRGNNTGLEMLVQVNRLIDSLKYCVVQTVMMTAVGEIGPSKYTILECIRIIIGQVETTVRHDNSEFTVEQFTMVKNKCVFILESMHILLSHMNIPQNVDIPEQRNDFDRYKEQQGWFKFKWLNIFNGSLFDDIMRVIVVGKMTGLPDAPNILELYRLFIVHIQRGGGDSRKHDNTIMTGGAKMTLSSFRDSGDEKRNELIATLIDWETMKSLNPPDQAAAYDSFYEQISTSTVPRGSDPRLIRLLHLERYSEMKKRVKDIRDGAQLRATPPSGRITRVVQQLIDDTTTLKDVIDAFMEQIKSYFDSLIAEEELAIEAAQAADAARPIRGDQRAVVYKMSHIIAKKGLEYASREFDAITRLLASGGLEQQTLDLLPNLGWFLPVASTYVRGIIGGGQVHDPGALTAGLPVPHDYMEKDKYDTLLFQLYLLGLIHRHGTAGGGGGLPDIDSRLAERMVQTLSSPDHTARYRRDGYVYLDNVESRQLFAFISSNHTQYNVMDNGIPSGIKGFLQSSTLCNIPARVDPAAGFGGCKDNNQEFDNMTMRVTDLEGRNIYITKHIYDPNRNTVTIVFTIILGDGTVISDTIPAIDLTKAPNVLSANRVMKDAIQEMINIWKSDPTLTPEALWALLETPENFVRLMKEVTKKGHGDIDQENSAFAPNAGFEDAEIARNRKWQKHLLFGAGDRPSAGRGINDIKFVVNRGDLFRLGQIIMSYTNEAKSFTLAHQRCIPESLTRMPGTKRQRGATASSATRTQRPVRLGGGGSLKFARRYTRKKSGVRR